MKFSYSTETQTGEDLLLEEEIVELKDLVLYNDDVNTFDFVIETLIKLCGHEALQAEQCAHIIHFSGKCAVKRGAPEKLVPICEAMLDRGLSAKIE